MTAKALTIAGSDSGGGAGIQADLKTFSALGVYGASVVTAVTAQNTRAVTAAEQVGAALVAAQLEAVFGDIAFDAVKIGMLGTVATIDTVVAGLSDWRGPVVLDPVMVAKSGDPLLSDGAVMAMRDQMLPLATLLTPNLPEAARLLDREFADDEAAMVEQGSSLVALGPQAVLMKGGHGAGKTCVDILVTSEDSIRFAAPRHATLNTHGTGCTLSAAVAAGLARGLALTDAVEAAHTYLQGAIASADRLEIGSGRGPVHHFHKIWNDD